MQLKLLLGALGVVAATAGTARADGSLTVRSAYYKEKSTRVVQPMMDGLFEIGERGVLAAHLLVDAITSASSGSGAANAAPFTERREEGGAGYTHTLDNIRVGGDAKYSRESDYFSKAIDGHAETDLAQKNATIGIGGAASFDTVTAGAAQGPSMPTLACDPGNLRVQASECPLHIYSGYATASQIVSRDLVVGATYDIADLRGFQSNPYRLVVANDGLVPERHPDKRFRQSVAASARYYIAKTATTLIAAYRFYWDDWSIHAHTPELRVVQEIGANADAGLAYRYYSQSAAFFYQPRYQTSDPAVNPFVSDDPKMSAFTGETIQAKLGVYGREFGGHGMWGDARFEGVLEYIVQHNAFGNAVEAQIAVALPFSY
jgi:hypothetical protein|nr:DUF3570 domain-containing protein [Kofleriaceae bacterium]